MAFLTAGEILASERPVEELEIPEWGGSVRLRALSAGQMTRWLDDNAQIPKIPHVNERLMALTVVDEAGAPLFSVDQIAALEDLAYIAYSRVLRAVLRMNALGTDESEELKKSLRDPSDDLPSA